MPTEYLILRSNVGVDKDIDLSRPNAWRLGTGGLSNLTIHLHDGRERDAGQLRQDPQNVAVMDANTVFSLISPRTRAAPDPTRLKPAGNLRMPEGLLAIKAHTCPYTGQGVTVAVLDTGVDADHPAFAGRSSSRATSPTKARATGT